VFTFHSKNIPSSKIINKIKFMHTKKRLFIAANAQHVGKTTCTLGLLEAFRQKGIHVGYCKPVGQETIAVDNLDVDKDALLFSMMMDFDLVARVHSPVTLGQGVTQKFLNHPENYHFKKSIADAAKILGNEYDLVIYEGTGHPGVGSVVDLSNADVAKMLKSDVILIAEGGIGNTLDRISLSLAFFRAQKVKVIGVIVNKVRPDKMDIVSELIAKKLSEWKVPLLGVIPYDKRLMFPLLDTVRKSIGGRILFNPEGMNTLVQDIVAGSLVDNYKFKDAEDLLLIVSNNRLLETLEKIENICHKQQIKNPPFCGIIITGDGRVEEHLENFNITDFVEKHNISVISTPLDTYGAAVQIAKIEPKINTKTPGKAIQAMELVQKYVNIDKIWA
jgi:dethiobiotin synthetase